MGAQLGSSKPWERRRDESPKAYRAFVAFRDRGEGRSFVAVGKQLGKSNSLTRRWASRYDWKERAWAWDVAQAREEESTFRKEREEIIRRQLLDADRLQRLAMAKLGELVRRDPESGELALDPGVTPRDAVLIYRLGLEIERKMPGAKTPEEEDADEETPETKLQRMTSQELNELVKLARGRAQGETEGDDDSTESPEEE